MATVTRTKRRLAERLVTLRFADGRVLRATPNHPLATPGGWVDAGELSAGAVVMGMDQTARVAEVQFSDGGEPVWDLTVEPTHSYFADGVWVHNY